MSKRKARKETKEVNFLKPIDITAFGTDSDPCFGKLYNPSTEECRRCGDSELCAVIFAQKMKKERTKEKATTRFKDEELEVDKPKGQEDWLSTFVRERKAEGLTRAAIIKAAKNTFGSTREEIKKIYKNV